MRKKLVNTIGFGVAVWVTGVVTGIGVGIIINQRGDRR